MVDGEKLGPIFMDSLEISVKKPEVTITWATASNSTSPQPVSFHIISHHWSMHRGMA